MISVYFLLDFASDLSFCLPTPLRGGKISLGQAERLPKIGKMKIEFNTNNFSDYGKNDRR